MVRTRSLEDSQSLFGMHKIRQIFGCSVVFICATATLYPALSFEMETRSAVKILQHAERIVAAAEKARDYQELKQQAKMLLTLFHRIPDAEDLSIKMLCGTAMSTLGTLADDLSEPRQARKVVAADGERRLYLDAMPKCEQELGLDPPSIPNLRTAK